MMTAVMARAVSWPRCRLRRAMRWAARLQGASRASATTHRSGPARWPWDLGGRVCGCVAWVPPWPAATAPPVQASRSGQYDYVLGAPPCSSLHGSRSGTAGSAVRHTPGRGPCIASRGAGRAVSVARPWPRAANRPELRPTPPGCSEPGRPWGPEQGRR